MCGGNNRVSDPDPYHLAGSGFASGNVDLDPGTKKIMINSHCIQINQNYKNIIFFFEITNFV